MDEQRADRLSTLLERSGGKYLTEREKLTLIEGAHPFMLDEVRRTPGRYGERWELTVRSPELWPGQRIVTMPANEARDAMLLGLVELAQEGPIGPLLLTLSKLPNGQRFYWLAKAAAIQEPLLADPE